MSKYIIELGDSAKKVVAIYLDEGTVWTGVQVVEDLEILNSDYINEHFGDLQDTAYQRGLNDAWEVARNISILESNGGYSWKEMKNIFGTDSPSEIYVRHTAAEAINKIKAYEEKQKAEDEIRVGDEVKWNSDLIVVTRLYEDGSFDWCDGISNDGRAFHILEKNACKTGRHFDIASILEEMKA